MPLRVENYDGSIQAEDIVNAMERPPSYPWVYQVPHWNMIGSAVSILFLLFFLSQILSNPRIFYIFDSKRSLAVNVVTAFLIWLFIGGIIAELFSCMWAFYYAIIGRMVLWQDALEVRRPFFSRTLKLTEIASKRFYKSGRGNQYMYIVLVQKIARN